jgi:hypothetical protein
MCRQHVLDVLEGLVGGVALHLVERNLFDIAILLQRVAKTLGAGLAIIARERDCH